MPNKGYSSALGELNQSNLSRFHNLGILECTLGSAGGNDRPHPIFGKLRAIKVPVWVGSTCTGYVYMFDVADVTQEADQQLLGFIQAAQEGADENLHFYCGNSALSFFAQWISGGLNRAKNYSDNYNYKTVEVKLKSYLNILFLLDKGDTIDIDSQQTNLVKQCEAKIEEIDQGLSLNKEEKKGWVKLELEGYKSAYSALKNKNPALLKKHGSLLNQAFETANHLRLSLEATKNAPDIKPLWVGSLKNFKSSGLREQILECRLDFVKDISDELVKMAGDRVLKEEDIEKYVTLKFSARIKELFTQLPSTKKAETSKTLPTESAGEYEAGLFDIFGTEITASLSSSVSASSSSMLDQRTKQITK